jgi:hypothetical protein
MILKTVTGDIFDFRVSTQVHQGVQRVTLRGQS